MFKINNKLLLIVCFILFVCTLVSAQPFSPSDYFPLAIGNHWRSCTQHDTTEPGDDRWSFIDIVDTVTFGIPGEILSYRVEYSENLFGHPDTTIYHIIYFSYTENGDLCWSASIVNSDSTVFDSLLIYLKNPIVIGDSVYFAGSGYEMTARVESVTDTLDIPLGQFENCLNIREYSTFNGQPNEDKNYIYIPCTQIYSGLVAGIGRSYGIHWESYPDSSRYGTSYLVECDIDSAQTGVNFFNSKPEFFTHLLQNYPNPFNLETVLIYNLPKSGIVSLLIYDINGREISNLVDNFQPAGIYQRTFDASGLSSGVYFACLKAKDFIQTRKLLLIK